MEDIYVNVQDTWIYSGQDTSAGTDFVSNFINFVAGESEITTVYGDIVFKQCFIMNNIMIHSNISEFKMWLSWPDRCV